VVGPAAPVILALCRSPNAAWSYFSTAAIFSYTAVVFVFDLVVAAGYVELSLSYSTMSSTSCNRSWSLVDFSDRSLSWSVSSEGKGADLDLVILWLVVSFAFALFSATCSFPSTSFTYVSSWVILPAIVLLMSSYSSMSSMSCVISLSISPCRFVRAFILSA
jgi:hypothetical protein